MPNLKEEEGKQQQQQQQKKALFALKCKIPCLQIKYNENYSKEKYRFS